LTATVGPLPPSSILARKTNWPGSAPRAIAVRLN
jgi:hypothetical protein